MKIITGLGAMLKLLLIRLLQNRFCNILLMALLAIIAMSQPAYCQSLAIIRDSETENFLYDLTLPIFTAANLDPHDISIYLVNDNSINAFVAGGQQVFINSGLIIKYDRPELLIGVIAHESGHIAAGHLARSSEEMGNIGTAMIFTYAAAIAAAIVNPSAGMALLMGGSQINERLALKFTRGQEESADLLALKYLDKINYPASGLLDLLQDFDHEENSSTNIIDEYALTHPVSKKRINFIKAHLKKTNFNSHDKILKSRMERIAVKLKAFLQDPDQTLNFYGQRTDQLAKYARSIAYFKKGQIQQSLKEIDQLIKINPQDGYLWEMKGQILFESGNIIESIIAYKKAIAGQKENPALARLGLASAIISLDSYDPELTDFAIKNLQLTLPKEKNNPMVFKALSNAYNQNKNAGRAYLALAEFDLLVGEKEKGIKNAKLAKKHLDKSDKSALLAAEDIISTTQKDLKKLKTNN